MAWRLRGWDDPDVLDDWLNRSVITMSADEIGDLTDWPGDDAVRARLRVAFPERTESAIGTFLTYWRGFRLVMTSGDVVLVPLPRSRFAVGEVIGDYVYDPSHDDVRLRHRRDVDWWTESSRGELDIDLRGVVNAPGTLGQVRATDAAERLRKAFDPLR